MPELMTGSHHSIDMVMSECIDTAARSFLNVHARGPPGSLNKSARGVNHVALLRDQTEKRKGGGNREGGDGEMQEKEKQRYNDSK